MATISMMDGAYFVGRVELLNWINDLLGLEYTKIEQMCSGVAACQVLDALYPGKVPLKKVNFNAKLEYEFISNFKILQKVFDDLHIDKRIDIEKLVKGKYQDNLEFAQWLKAYYDRNSKGEPYNAAEKREAAQAAQNQPSKPKAPTSTSTTAPPKKPATTTTAPPKETKSTSPTPKETKTHTSPPPKTNSKSNLQTSGASSKSTPSKDTNAELTQLKMAIAELEKERDFYFTKLRDIEVYCQRQDQENELVKHITKILYATDPDQEFVTEEDTN
jgi:RP/EB family microtubule-associated protein